MTRIAICNQKGGAAKTTTTGSLAVAMSRLGERAHVIDMDPQASLSKVVFNVVDKEEMLYEALKSRSELPVVKIDDMISMSPGSLALTKGEREFLGEPANEFMLKQALDRTDLPEGTIVLIDCPPSLGIFTFNCLTAADQVIIPIEPDDLAADPLPNLVETIRMTQEHLNPSLQILGAILTKVDGRKKISNKFEVEVGKAFPLLGVVHSETKFQYAVGDGRLLRLKESRAFDEYNDVAAKVLNKVWQTNKAK